MDPTRRDVYLACLATFGVGAGLGGLLMRATHDDPPPPPAPEVAIETEALLDAATIRLRGYGPDGTPGSFLYDCDHDGKQLVCTQRSEP